MAALADQIIEMLNMLEIIDPAAAAAIRSGVPVRAAPAAAKPPDTRLVDVEIKKTTQATRSNLRMAPTTDNLMQAVIYSEILGKPLSKRGAKRPF